MSVARFAFQACSFNRIAAPLAIPRQIDRRAAGQDGYTVSRFTDIFDVPYKSFRLIHCSNSGFGSCCCRCPVLSS
jgi:hypothetical protein